VFVYRYLNISSPEDREKTRHRLSTSTGKVIRGLSDLRRSYFGQEGSGPLVGCHMQLITLRAQFADVRLPTVQVMRPSAISFLLVFSG
jgi:hypothetical protein